MKKQIAHQTLHKFHLRGIQKMLTQLDPNVLCTSIRQLIEKIPLNSTLRLFTQKSIFTNLFNVR